MKFTIIFVVLFSTTLFARDLNTKEKALLFPLAGTLKVADFMANAIDQNKLNWGQKLLYKGLKVACGPLILLKEDILQGDIDYPDQTSNITILYHACSEGTLALTRIYINQKK